MARPFTVIGFTMFFTLALVFELGQKAAVVALADKFEANIVAKAAVLAEGDAAERDDIVFLEKLPLFFK